MMRWAKEKSILMALHDGYRDPNADPAVVPTNEYQSADGKYLYTINGTTLTVSLISDPDQKLTINNYTSGQLGITLNDTLPGEPLEFFGTGQDDFIIDVASTMGGAPGSHIINEITDGEDKEFTSPVQRIEGRGGNDSIQINADIPNLVIYGDSSGVNPELDGNDFIEVDRLNVGSNVIPTDTSQGATIHGEGGDDLVSGSQRDDFLYCDAGHDTVFGAYGNDLMIGGTGNDLLVGHEGRDTLIGGEDNDHVLGGEANDVLFGSSGDDRLYGDSSLGGGFLWDGNNEEFLNPDIFWFDPDQNGQAVQVFGAIDDVDTSDHAIDVLYGGSGDDKLYGGGDNDYLYGGGDNDHLEGEAGDDQLFGGEGNDVLWGDISLDTYDNNTAFIENLTINYANYDAKFIFRSYAYDKDVAGNDNLFWLKWRKAS